MERCKRKFRRSKNKATRFLAGESTTKNSATLQLDDRTASIIGKFNIIFLIVNEDKQNGKCQLGVGFALICVKL